MNRNWHDAEGSPRTPTGGTHRAPAPFLLGGPRPLSVEERFQLILDLERLRDRTPSKLMHDVAVRAIASMEDSGEGTRSAAGDR